MNLPKAFSETSSPCPCWYTASKQSRTGRYFCTTVAFMLNKTWQETFLTTPPPNCQDRLDELCHRWSAPAYRLAEPLSSRYPSTCSHVPRR